MKLGETKSSVFKRLATNRTNNVIKSLRLIGNLSNRNNYNYSQDDFRSIFNSIEEEFKLARARFQVALSKKRRFKL